MAEPELRGTRCTSLPEFEAKSPPNSGENHPTKLPYGAIRGRLLTLSALALNLSLFYGGVD